MSTPASSTRAAWRFPDLLGAARRAGALWRAAASVGMAFLLTAMLILLAGKNPLTAYYHLLTG